MGIGRDPRKPPDSAEVAAWLDALEPIERAVKSHAGKDVEVELGYVMAAMRRLLGARLVEERTELKRDK